jgi:hypothetical protein
LVCPHPDDTFPAMARRPTRMLASRIGLMARVHSDLASILTGQGNAA